MHMCGWRMKAIRIFLHSGFLIRLAGNLPNFHSVPLALKHGASFGKGHGLIDRWRLHPDISANGLFDGPERPIGDFAQVTHHFGHTHGKAYPIHHF